VKKIIEKLKRDLTVIGRSQDTINLYLNISQKFLSKYKEISEDTIKDYLYNLKKSNYSDNYLRLVHYILCRLAKTEKKDIELPPPKIEKQNVYQPIFTFEEVKKLIINCKKYCNLQQKAYFAVSTIWGLRKIEIIRIRKEDINKKDNTIFIRTAKGGRPQIYTIPEKIRDIIYDFNWEEISKAKIYVIFNHALYLCKFDLSKYIRYGFHSIRRSLITEMIRAGIDNYTVALWCRWAISSFGMLPVYSHLVKEDLEKIVYPKHPFLKFW